MTINPMCNLSITDYVETGTAVMTGRLLPDHMSEYVEWVGYGTVAGLRARCMYYTLDTDTTEDAGNLDWDDDNNRVEIITDDDVVLVTL